MSDQSWRAAAESGDINLLYAEIKQNPRTLEIDDTLFVETPLHIAASSGHLRFAAEMMRLKPSFALKPNPEGRCPIHIALERGDKRMALQFVHMNKDLVRAKMREGLTPLHFASQSGDVDLLNKLLEACPDSIEDETVKGETALHLAVKYQQFDALKCLVKWLVKKPPNLETSIVNREDEDGNTILHIAASNNDTEAIKLLLKHTKYTICLDAKNLMNKTASDLASNPHIKRKLARATFKATMIWIGWLIIPLIWWVIRKTRSSVPMSEENRNAYLVVATLVATATYQAALSPPGGLHQIDAPTNNTTLIHSPSNSTSNSTILEGKSAMSDINFILFSTTNMSAFLASTLTIIGLLPRSVAWFLLYVSTALLVCSYYFSMIVISPSELTTIYIEWVSILTGSILLVMVFGTITFKG